MWKAEFTGGVIFISFGHWLRIDSGIHFWSRACDCQKNWETFQNLVLSFYHNSQQSLRCCCSFSFDFREKTRTQSRASSDLSWTRSISRKYAFVASRHRDLGVIWCCRAIWALLTYSSWVWGVIQHCLYGACVISRLVMSDSLQPYDCSPPGSSVHGILQARILEWVAMPSSRGSSWPRDRTHVSCGSCICRQILYLWATGKALLYRWVNLTLSF